MLGLLIFVWLGTLAGILLARIAPEELDDGRKWFRLFYVAMAAMVAAVSFQPILGNLAFIAAIATALIAWFMPRYELSYSMIALMLPGFYAVTYSGFLSVAVFIMGMPVGTLVAEEHTKKKIIPAILLSLRWFLPSLAINMATTLIY